jgi:hypothetical protein
VRKLCFIPTPAKRGTLLAVALSAALSVSSPNLRAQQSEGAITGTVKDAQGASIPGATVKALNILTKQVYPAISNGDGLYSILLLPTGSYEVSIAVPGFEKTIQHLEVHASDHLLADFALRPGSENTVVNVESTAPLLEGATGDSGLTVSSTEVHDLPQLARNPFNLVTLAPGAALKPGMAANVSLRPFDNGGFDYISVNGGRGFTTEVTIDGLANVGDEQAVSNQVSNINFVPSPDMTQEFRVQTSVYDAQFGRSGGGFIALNLKSGTDALHGTLSYYLQNTILNANSYANKRQGVARSAFHWSQPGAVVSGPVVIPKLYDGRGKTFFMFGWEEVHSNTPAPTYSTVPTVLERTGDFSQSLAGGKPAAIYDPLTTTANSSGGYTRTAFSNSKLTRMDPVAVKIAALLPLPNVPGAGNSNNLYAAPNNGADAYDAFSARVDHNVSQAHRLSFVYLQSKRHQTQGLSGFPAAIAPSYRHYRINYGAHINWNWTISPTLISSFGIGWNGHQFAIEDQQDSFDLSSVGFPSYLGGSAAPALFPRLSIAGYSTFGNAGYGTGSYNTNNTYDLRETLIKSLKRHDISFGGEVRPMRDSRSLAAGNSSLGFGRDFTQANPLAGDAVSGNGFASFLLGYADTGSLSQSPRFGWNNGYYALFAQDNWRISDKFTLTLGLRWDTESPIVEAHGIQNTGFDPNASYTFAGQSLHGQVLFGTNGGRSKPYNADLNNFGPRVGFAYAPYKKFTMRGGFGILYSPTFDAPSSTGFSASTSYVASNNNLLTPALPTSLSNPYPSGFVVPSGASANLNGQGGWTYWNNNTRQIPRTTQYSLGVEYELPKRSVLELRYVGQLTNNLPNSRNQNFTSIANLALGNKLNTTVVNPFAGQLPGTSLNNPTITLQQSLLPFPQYTSFNRIITNGTTNYNGLQARVEKRLTDGLNVRVSYSYSKSMVTGYLNDQDTDLRNWIDPLGLTHNLTIAGGYALPFFNKGNKVLQQTLGGWSTNVIVSKSSGMLYGAPGGVQATGINPRVANPTFQREFDTCTLTTSGTRQNCIGDEPAVWTITPAFTLNQLNPYFGGFRVPVPVNVNLSLFKAFPIYDEMKLQFRAEAFNLTNTPSFAGPDTGVNNTTFGKQTNFSQVNNPRILQLALRLTF